MSRKKPAKAPTEPPLDWLRQSVWAGEELPDELDMLEWLEPQAEAGARAKKPEARPAGGRAKRRVDRA